MKTKYRQQRGVVLVVVLVMLSMVTFLVVAMVGFSRSERASVTASMARTEIGFAREYGLLRAQEEMIDQIGNNINRGLTVSQNIDGANVNEVPPSQEKLLEFAKGDLANNGRPPVYVDRLDSNGSRGRDDILDTFQFHWDLNSARNSNNTSYQATDENMNIIGDPHWIGILEKPGEPHGPNNKFVARFASMTVPAHKALNIRYNHNDLKSGGALDFDRYDRREGLYPKEINLAAPLGILDRKFFGYDAFNPYDSNPSIPAGTASAFNFASAFHHFGYDIEDTIFLSQPSLVYNELLDRYRGWNDFNGTAAGQLVGLKDWLASRSPDGTHIFTPPYSYYQFMESFSSTPLPPEPEKFDVNGIRDEVVYKYARVNTSQPGFPFPLTFDPPHDLKSGDKLEWSWTGNPPRIYDPINFKSIHDGLTSPQKRMRWENYANLGEVQTEVPHRLMAGDSVRIITDGITGGLRLLYRDPSATPISPWSPISLDLLVKSAEETKLALNFPSTPAGLERAWGSQLQSGIWQAKYRTNFSLYPTGIVPDDLPDEFANATLTITYRYSSWQLDRIPYFAKVISPTSVSLHRSAELDEKSRVNFYYPPSQFQFTNADNVFTGLGPYTSFFQDGDWVRFDIPPNADGSPGELSTGSGPITMANIFLLKEVGSTMTQFRLGDPADPSSSFQLSMSQEDGYTLWVVPKSHRYKRDGLTAAMEKMAGLMLNESLDTTGDGPTGPLPDFHSLGGQLLQEEEDPPVAFPLEMGIGGHAEPLGPWHKPQKGIPWGRSENPAGPFLTGKGRYTREMERIVQVAANIADLYSGYQGGNLPIAGSEWLDCNSSGALRQLPFGKPARDQSVSARIQQCVGGYCSVVLCGGYEVRCVITGPNLARVELRVKNPDGSVPTLVAKSNDVIMTTTGLGSAALVEYRLQAECEGGRRVRVALDGRRIIDYEDPKTLYGKAALWAQAPGLVKFTDLKPGVMPAELIPANPPIWYISGGRPPAVRLPTAWRGVFRRDENNNIYLTGFQRWKYRTVGRNQDPTTSWYQRNAPMVIGVKDRSTLVATGTTLPGRNLVPAFTEFSLRTVYDRVKQGLYGRLTAEVKAPGLGGVSYRSRLRATITDGNYTRIYTKTIAKPPLPAWPNLQETGRIEGTFKPNVSFLCDNPLKFFNTQPVMIASINDATGVATTKDPHRLLTRQNVVLSGLKPAGWNAGVAPGDIEGTVMVVSQKEFYLIKPAYIKPAYIYPLKGLTSDNAEYDATGLYTQMNYANSVTSPALPHLLPLTTTDPKQEFAGLPNPRNSAFARLTGTEPNDLIEISGKITNPSWAGSYLTDIVLHDMTIHVEGEIYCHDSNGAFLGTVDYINDDLKLSGPVHFANKEEDLKGFSLNPVGATTEEWLKILNFDYLGSGNPNIRKDVGMRKLDISWQVNDPLVNSHGSDYTDKNYSPGGHFKKLVATNTYGDDITTPQVRRRWVPRSEGVNGGRFSPLTFNINWPAADYPTVVEPQSQPLLAQLQYPQTGWDEGFPIYYNGQPYKSRLGVNLGLRNEVGEPWKVKLISVDPDIWSSDLPENISSIKDPGVKSHVDWRFPDISRGRIANVGWLGQVHRGTPWQTLYLKSKVPGRVRITSINDLTGIVTTASPHNLIDDQAVEISGAKPAGWPGPDALMTGTVSVTGLNVNEFILNKVGLPNYLESYNPAKPNLTYLTPGLFVSSDTWGAWAGSWDTMPANDRRLLEVFSVGTGAPVRGRFSVNSRSVPSWSAALCGLSVPYSAAVPIVGGGTVWHDRILGANNPDQADYQFTDRWGTYGTHDSSDFTSQIDIHPNVPALFALADPAWDGNQTRLVIVNNKKTPRILQIPQGINAIRGKKMFTRVTDILAVPQISDDSPYLPLAWETAQLDSPGFQDELDLERIPMQLMSLLRVDEQPRFVTYICAEKLRPGLRLTVLEKPYLPLRSGESWMKDFDNDPEDGKISKSEASGNSLLKVKFDQIDLDGSDSLELTELDNKIGYSGPAKSVDGIVLNYEVVGQTARRVVYKLSNAKEWHQSIKNKHPGQWRDREGDLRPLPPLRPVILHSSALQIN